MRKVGRAFIAGILILGGCADETFDLLPATGSEPSDQTGQSGDTGTGDASAMGGTGAKGGSGGSAATSDGGIGDDPGSGCGPGGCVPSGCKPEDGCCTRNDDCGAPTPYCSPSLHRCVNCRAYYDCAPGESCVRDCLTGESCDPVTSLCAPICNDNKPCSTGFLRVCEPMRQVCVECEPNDHPGAIVCDHDLKCNYAGECVECLSAYDCQTEEKPVCNFATSRCEPCAMDAECNPGSHPPGYIPRTCDDAGHCVTPPPPPPPPSQ